MPKKGTRKVWIPEVSRERIQELATRIKPIVRFSGQTRLRISPKGEAYYIEPVDLFEVAFTYNPKATEKASGLKALCEIRTYHEIEGPWSFVPSIAEVLAQIPPKYLAEVVAFEIVERPSTKSDVSREPEAYKAGYHVAKTRLYVRQ